MNSDEKYTEIINEFGSWENYLQLTNKKPYVMTQDLIMPLSIIEFIGKEEIKQLATNNVNELLIRGEQSPLKQYVLFKKIAEYVSVAIDKLKDSAQVEGARFNKQYSYGAKVELRYTGDKLDYSSDLIYQELEIKLKQRKDLLNMAYKSIGAVIFDADGCEVPSVDIKTNGTESLFITF